MLNSDYDRKLINFRLNHEVSKNFKVGFNVRFDNQLINGTGTSNPGSSGLNFLRQTVRDIFLIYLPGNRYLIIIRNY